MTTLEETLQHIPTQSVLDVATGRGNALETLFKAASRDAVVVGVDLSRVGMAAARLNRSDPRLHLAQMDAERMGFVRATFDLVSISMSLHHLRHLDRALEEMVRVLRMGGHLLVVEMYRNVETPQQQSHVMLHDWWAEIDLGLGTPHFPTFKREEIRRLVSGLGLQEVWASEISGPENDDPTDPEKVKMLLEVCDEYIERARRQPESRALTARGEALKERVSTIGLQWAPALVYLGRKGS